MFKNYYFSTQHFNHDPTLVHVVTNPVKLMLTWFFAWTISSFSSSDFFSFFFFFFFLTDFFFFWACSSSSSISLSHDPWPGLLLSSLPPHPISTTVHRRPVHRQPPQLRHYWGNTPEQDYYNLQGIKSSKSFYTSPRGLKLFTRQWLPISHPPRGIIFMVHGYGNDINWTFQATPIFLAQNGFACFALDLEAHGQSHGLRAFVPDVDLVVQDYIFFFNFIKQNPQFQNLPSFLYGESMGSVICLLIHFADPKAFHGAILVAPMCKISDVVKPKWPTPKHFCHSLCSSVSLSHFVLLTVVIHHHDLHLC